PIDPPAISLLPYTTLFRSKYQDRADLAPAMGRWMARAGQELLDEADWLIPVPLHWRRAWHRRYNQSGALARAIERQSGVKVRGEDRKSTRLNSSHQIISYA